MNRVVHFDEAPLRLGILTRSPKLFGQTINAIVDSGHSLDVIEPSSLILSLSGPSPKITCAGPLKAGQIRDLDVLFNHAGREWINILSEAFAALSIPVLNDRQAIEMSVDKLKALIKVAGSGLRIPETTLLSDGRFQTRLVEAESLFGYPMVVKESRTDRGEKVFLAHDRREVWEIWSNSVREDLFLLQRFIIGDHLRVFIVGERVVYCVRTVPALGDFRSNRRFSTWVEPAPLSNIEARSVSAACRQLGLFYAGVDLIRNGEGLWFLEANAQPGIRDDLTLFPGRNNQFRWELGSALVTVGLAVRRQGRRGKIWS